MNKFLSKALDYLSEVEKKIFAFLTNENSSKEEVLLFR